MAELTIFSRMPADKLAQTLHQYAAAQHDLAAKTDEDRIYWHHFALASLLEECAERIATVKSP